MKKKSVLKKFQFRYHFLLEAFSDHPSLSWVKISSFHFSEYYIQCSNLSLYTILESFVFVSVSITRLWVPWEKKNVTLLIFSPHSLAECLAHSNNSINIHWNEKTFNGPQFTLSIIWTLPVRIYSFLNIQEDTTNCFPESSRITPGYLLSPNFPLHHQPFRIPVIDSILDFNSSIYSPWLSWSSFLRLKIDLDFIHSSNIYQKYLLCHALPGTVVTRRQGFCPGGTHI